MNLGPKNIASTYQFVLNQSGSSITLGNGDAVNWGSNGIVMTSGNQTISGSKTFITRPTVNGSGVLLTDETGNFYPKTNPSGYVRGVENVVYGTGNQTIEGVKTFTSRPTVNGSGVLLTGETGNFYPRSNPSGYISSVSNVVATTGDQTISGEKQFAQNAYFQQYLTVSGDCILGCQSNAVSSFGTSALVNFFGTEAANNDFGGVSTINNFGSGAGNNNFGSNSTENYFGNESVDNYFGRQSSNNFFGDGLGAENWFGLDGSTNHFGISSSNNFYGEGSFEGPVRLYLEQFSGSKNQAGQIGELKVSGSGLYICTGIDSWGRVFISSF